MDDKINMQIKNWSTYFELDFELVKSLIQIESSGNPWAMRYESKWRWFLKPSYWAWRLKISDSTERIAQSSSFGLCQVMGAVARELGFEGHLTELCDPAVGIKYGCKKLKQCIDRYDGDIRKGLAAYNAGYAASKIGQRYADKVMKQWERQNET